MGFPIWIIAVVVVVVVALFSGIGGYIFISRKRRGESPQVIDIEAYAEKAPAAVPAAPVLEDATPSRSPPAYSAAESWSSSTSGKEPSTTEPCPDEKPSPPLAKRKSSRKHESKISLPMPPASSSLFSDKMELSSEEAMELFDRYMNADLDKSNNASSGGGFTANIQQKAATIRSTVRGMSLRRKSTSKGGSMPLNQLFETIDKPPASPSVSSHTNSTPSLGDQHPMPPTPTTPARHQQPSVPPPSFSPPTPSTAEHHDLEDDATAVGSPAADEAPKGTATTAPTTPNGNAAAAARRVIRTASRKSKTRSMLVSEDDVMKMFGNGEDIPSEQRPMPAGAGSMRRLPRELSEKSASVSAMRAAARSKANASAASARDIAEWFPGNKGSGSAGSSGAGGTATVAGRVPHHRPAPPVQTMFAAADTEEDSTNPRGNVDNVRKMLQATWQANMRESTSMASIVSTTEAAVAASSNSSAARYGRQNPLLRSAGNATQQRHDDQQLQQPPSPPPVASFSSSTVRTVVPAADQQKQQQQQQQQQCLTSIAAQEKIEIDGTNFTMLSAQSGYKTWNGRSSRSSRPSLNQTYEAEDQQASKIPQPQQQQPSNSSSNNTSNASSSFFNTVSLGRRQSSKRRVMPWMDDKQAASSTNRTPAQRERDQYLKSLYDDDTA